MEKVTIAKTIDEYIERFPEEVQIRLKKVRETIRKAAPDATESISYAIPAFNFKGYLVYFAAYKNHISVYPVSSLVTSAIPELAPFKTSKGTAQFPHNKPLPLTLITKLTKFRMRENKKKAEN